MRNYFLIIGSTSYFDDYLSKIDVEKDSFIELVRQDDTQRKGGVITWDPSPNLVVRNSDYHGLVASAHDRLGELIKEFTTEDAYIYLGWLIMHFAYFSRYHCAGDALVTKPFQ